MLAGKLHSGEPVREADGARAIVERVRVIPGAASMWDLTVSNVHDFAVGDSAFVVHNCGGGVSDVDPNDPRAFTITDWSGYPATGNVPQPEGPFKFLQGQEYADARTQGNAGAKAYGSANNVHSPYQSHHIQPIQFGGDPANPSNLMPLSSPWPHQEYTNWWNALRDELRSGDLHRIQFLNPGGYL